VVGREERGGVREERGGVREERGGGRDEDCLPIFSFFLYVVVVLVCTR